MLLMKRYSELHCNDAEVRIKSLTITQLASALEDSVTRKVAGRQDAGDSWTVTFNYTPEVAAQLKQMISDYNTGKASGLRTWFEVWIPNATNGFFVVAEPPQVLSMPEFSQNSLLTIDLTLAVQEYIGDSVAIEPVAG